MQENSAYFVPRPFSPMHFKGMFAIMLLIVASQFTLCCCVLLRPIPRGMVRPLQSSTASLSCGWPCCHAELGCLLDRLRGGSGSLALVARVSGFLLKGKGKCPDKQTIGTFSC